MVARRKGAVKAPAKGAAGLGHDMMRDDLLGRAGG